MLWVFLLLYASVRSEDPEPQEQKDVMDKKCPSGYGVQ
jgi:hypothetical protein